MPSGDQVRPKKWKQISVLFDDDSSSVISGFYADGTRPSLGIRWNGAEGELGFPNVVGKPIWHVVPDFLAIPILLGLLAELAGRPDPSSTRFVQRIRRQLLAQYTAQIDDAG